MILSIIFKGSFYEYFLPNINNRAVEVEIPAQVSGFSRDVPLGERYLLEMDYEQAVIYFERVIKIEPKNARAYMGLAEAYDALGQTDKAIETLRLGLERTSDPAIAGYLAVLEMRNAPVVAAVSEEPTPEPIVAPTVEPTQEPTAASTEAVAPTIEPTTEPPVEPTTTAIATATAEPITTEPNTAVAVTTEKPTIPVVATNSPLPTSTPISVNATSIPTTAPEPTLPPNVSQPLEDILIVFASRDIDKTAFLIKDTFTHNFANELVHSLSWITNYNHNTELASLELNDGINHTINNRMFIWNDGLVRTSGNGDVWARITLQGFDTGYSYTLDFQFVSYAQEYEGRPEVLQEMTAERYSSDTITLNVAWYDSENVNVTKWVYRLANDMYSVVRSDFTRHDGYVNGDATISTEFHTEYVDTVHTYKGKFLDGYIQLLGELRDDREVAPWMLPLWIDENGNFVYIPENSGELTQRQRSPSSAYLQ